MMVVVPYKYTAQVSAIPTTCRTIGQSFTLCVTSMIQQMIYETRVEGQEMVAWHKGLFANQIIFFCVATVVLLLMVLRTGYLATESHKKRYDPKKVRILKVADEDQQTDNLIGSTELK